MARRIAVIDNKKIKDMQQKEHLMRVCPVNKTGAECIYLEDDNRLGIAENLCIGCGICVKAAPNAISIINLPEQLDQDPLHRYGRNGFHLYNLPIPIFGKVVGILGKNGIGKSTAMQILAGMLKPNLGKDTEKEPYEADIKELIDHFKGTEAQNYFERLRDGKVKIAVKPQMVDAIPKQFDGTVKELLANVSDDETRIASLCQELSLTPLIDRDIKHISGGELQRVAIVATVLKDANVFFFDEPTSYLDIKQRLIVSRFIRKLASEGTAVIVIEHDLIILDYMTDLIHLMYGQENVYGVVSHPKSTKAGINVYLDGYLRDENIRFRDYKISFHSIGEEIKESKTTVIAWEDLHAQLGDFSLTAHSGEINKHNVVGVLGQNGIGKTSFVRILADVIKPEQGSVDGNVKVSYKPQYIESSDQPVAAVLSDAIQKYKLQLIRPLDLERLFDQQLSQLSGGQLQRVAIAAALAREADIYLLDEPSAYLDVEQRLTVSKIIKDFMIHKGAAAIVVDHDLLFLDYLSSKLMVFDGIPSQKGLCSGPFTMQDGMNRFLGDIQMTFRRDDETNRPRANKEGSQMDQKQKAEERLYYV